MKQHLSTGYFRPHLLIVLLLMAPLLLPLGTHAESQLLGAEIQVETREIKDEVWPQVEAKALIKASPLASAAIFAAYDYQKNYVPGLLKSQVTVEEVLGKTNNTHVSYTMDMPWPISDSEYIHGHELSQPQKGSYKVRWYMVKSDSAENVRGHALFEPHPAMPQYTLLTYQSLVTPKSFLAGIFKKIMVKDVRKAIEATRDTTEKLLTTNPKLVEKYQDKIKNVLAGKRAYLP